MKRDGLGIVVAVVWFAVWLGVGTYALNRLLAASLSLFELLLPAVVLCWIILLFVGRAGLRALFANPNPVVSRFQSSKRTDESYVALECEPTIKEIVEYSYKNDYLHDEPLTLFELSPALRAARITVYFQDDDFERISLALKHVKEIKAHSSPVSDFQSGFQELESGIPQ